MKLQGLASSKISTPFGLVTLSRNGDATLSQDQADFINERIAAGCLPDYAVIDENSAATTETPPDGKEKK